MLPDSGNGDVNVDCKSTNLGFIAVFAINSSVVPQTSTAQTPTLSTPQVTPESQLYIQFKLVGNFADFVTVSSKPEFISTITVALANAMDVQKSRVTNVDVQPGSILVSFTLLPGGPGQNNVSTAASALRELVTSGNFSVTLADGRTLFADAASFQTSSIPFTTSSPQSIVPTTKLEEKPTETSAKLSTGVLFGIIIGSIVGVMALIVGVILFVNKRSRLSKVDYTSHQDNQTKLAFSPSSGN